MARAAPPFVEFANQTRGAVDLALAHFLSSERAKLETSSPVFDAVDGLTQRGGKRLRSVLLEIAFDGFATSPNGEAVRAGQVSLELLQSYLLIHDDWMDGDSVRRGGPAAHVELGRVLGSPQAGAHAAILSGDLGAGLALRALCDAPAAPSHVVAALAELAAMQVTVVLGQERDMFPGGTPTLAEIESMYHAKTGSYTVTGPLCLGAALAGASAAARAALRAYARPLGIAFQIRDDLLSAFGAPEETGKPLGSDLLAGKLTVLWAMLHEHDPALGERVRARALRHEELPEVLASIERAGVKARAEARVDELLEEADGLLVHVGFVETSANRLREAARVLGQRRS
jgi:geranylgeranyl diphosphate synthase type I